jgi:SAM-dependent methyltransferase
MMAEQLWLEAVWPFVRDHVPTAPSRVLEIGCGPLGGFVPALRDQGHQVVGVDPRAPAASDYQQATFEEYNSPHQVDAVIASTSLHHVTDLDEVLDRIAAVLIPGGTVVVVEWAWEQVDARTAGWCFARLGRSTRPSWLTQRRDEWQASGQSWDTYLTGWASGQGLHPGDVIRCALDQRFHRLLSKDGPYYFPDLDDTTEADEQAAIDTGVIRATATRYVGRLRIPAPAAGDRKDGRSRCP